MSAHEAESFASLFKKYRLRSEVDTLSEFGDLLASVGYVYETSLFSHWQKNERIPRDRRLVLEIIKIFNARGGIRTTEEANSLLASVHMRDMSHDELHDSLFEGFRVDKIAKIKTDAIKTYSKHYLIFTYRNKYSCFVFLLYAFINVWYLRINVFRLNSTLEPYIVGELYSLFALGAFIYVRYSLRHNVVDWRMANVSKLLSYGLFSQWIGLEIWTYYNALGVAVPYPSFADIGYFGLIPFYIVATLLLYDYQMQRKLVALYNKGLLYYIGLLLMLVVSLVVFINTLGISYTLQLRTMLGISYPLGEVIPMFITLHTFILGQLTRNTTAKLCSFILFIALLIQFLAEYGFIYVGQTNSYVNGGFIDFLYATSYMAMNLVLILFVRLAKEGR